MLGHITAVTEVENFNIKAIAPMNGENGGRLGAMQMIHGLHGSQSMDGYKVDTDEQSVYVLIDNGQSCCEDWGYFASEDDMTPFIGAELTDIVLTDKALNTQKVEQSGYYDDAGGIQFVDFVTDRGTFQLAVYNAHNGYYGHGIVIAKGDEVVLNNTL